MEDFSQMPLKKELIEVLKNMGFVSPTDVQREAIPVILSGKDTAVRAKTGTGKTGAFAIPIMQMLAERPKPMSVLVLVPTRELALQVSDVMHKMGRPLGLITVTVYGGASINIQINAVRKMPDIIVGTPGRLIDLIRRGVLDLKGIRFLVLDEADMMFDMGFIEDIEYILRQTPDSKQTLLFSATLPKPIMAIAQKHMKPDKQILTVGKEEDITASGITHLYTVANGSAKFATLIAYINQYKPTKGIIFTMTKMGAEHLYNVLEGEGLDVISMHGGMTQSKRENSLRNFKSGAQFMISTNIAARGLDIADVTDIINFDAPDDPHIYIHRVGRSARMHKEGRAFTMFSSSQKGLVEAIKDTANIEMQYISLDITGIDQSKFSKYHRSEGYPRPRGRGFGFHSRNQGHGRPFSRDGGSSGRPFSHNGGGSGSSRSGPWKQRRRW